MYANGLQSSTSERTKMPSQNTAATTHLRSDERERPSASGNTGAACDGGHLVSEARNGSCLAFWSFSSWPWLYFAEGFQEWGVRLSAQASCKKVDWKFLSSNMQTSPNETQAIKNTSTKTIGQKHPAKTQLKSGDREQHVASASAIPMLAATSSAAHGFIYQ